MRPWAPIAREPIVYILSSAWARDTCVLLCI